MRHHLITLCANLHISPDQISGHWITTGKKKNSGPLQGTQQAFGSIPMFTLNLYCNMLTVLHRGPKDPKDPSVT